MGKTHGCWIEVFVEQKHPHGRGENDLTISAASLSVETPPRAWGKPTFSSRHESGDRNTPTGVGKTGIQNHHRLSVWKHPHGRGENYLGLKAIVDASETPPRAWGKQIKRLRHQAERRNTPTGVGKTPAPIPLEAVRGKHPHGRGENRTEKSISIPQPETPPRAWGKHFHYGIILSGQRNTPTGVGKTNQVHKSLLVR